MLFLSLQLAATPDRPIVLFLDSLDQLTSAHRAHNLSWLPHQLPPNVHLVLSTLPYEHDLLDTLRVLITSEKNFIQILPLGQALSKNLVKEWLDSARRDLTTSQFEIVSDALSRCSLPLYTRLVFEEVCRWSSFSPPDQTKLQFTVKGIINKLLDKVSHLFPLKTVSSRQGKSSVFDKLSTVYEFCALMPIS